MFSLEELMINKLSFFKKIVLFLIMYMCVFVYVSVHTHGGQERALCLWRQD